jgi:hypothetical protein
LCTPGETTLRQKGMLASTDHGSNSQRTKNKKRAMALARILAKMFERHRRKGCLFRRPRANRYAATVCDLLSTRTSTTSVAKQKLRTQLDPRVRALTNALLRSQGTAGDGVLPLKLDREKPYVITRLDVTYREADSPTDDHKRIDLHVDAATMALIVGLYASEDLEGGELVVCCAPGGRFEGYVPIGSCGDYERLTTICTRQACAREESVMRIQMRPGTAIILAGDIEHFVAPVTVGSRGTLVAFFQ